MQYYGLTGRKIKPDYVGVVNAGTKYLPQKKELADTEEYRNKMLALDAESLAQNERFAKDTLKAREKETEQSTLIGLGQLGMKANQGRTRDAALKEVLTGGGGGKAPGAISPDVSGSTSSALIPDGDNTRVSSNYGLGGASKAGNGIWEGLKGGASNWGDIAMGTMAGATVGAKLGEKYISKNDTGRAIGGAVTSGALSYLSSGNLYTSAISSIFGGALAALL